MVRRPSTSRPQTLDTSPPPKSSHSAGRARWISRRNGPSPHPSKPGSVRGLHASPLCTRAALSGGGPDAAPAPPGGFDAQRTLRLPEARLVSAHPLRATLWGQLCVSGDLMGFHHVAVAVNDLAATHDFYTEAMGFALVKAVVAPTDAPGGWAKHVFYDTGGDGLIAFWELHDPRKPSSSTPASPGGPGPACLESTTSPFSTLPTSRLSTGAASDCARPRHRRVRARPRLLSLDLRHRSQRNPGRMVHRHRSVHRGRPFPCAGRSGRSATDLRGPAPEAWFHEGHRTTVAARPSA